MRELLGELPDVEGMLPAERERHVVNTYRRSLCQAMPTEGARRARSAYVRILDPNKERAKYHLVYLTRHPRGIIEFMTRSEQLELVQKHVRAIKKSDKRSDESGTEDMFGASSYVDERAGRAEQDAVDLYWRQFLSPGGKHVGEEEFANMLEQTNWFPGDFQQSLGRLISRGEVRNAAAARSRPKQPLHWDQREYLELMGGSK